MMTEREHPNVYVAQMVWKELYRALRSVEGAIKSGEALKDSGDATEEDLADLHLARECLMRVIVRGNWTRGIVP